MAFQLNLYRHFSQYVNLTHSDTYIHGPFNIATFGGRKSCDRVGGNDWSILQSCTPMFHNSVPSLEVTTYSVHTLKPALIPHSTAVPPLRICHRITRWRMIFSSYILDKRSWISGRYPHFSFLFFSFGDPSGYDGYFRPQPIAIRDGIPGLTQSMKSFKFGSSVPFLAHLARDDLMSLSNVFGLLKGLGP